MSCISLKKPKLGAEIGTEMIQIEVGCDNKRQTFIVHKALLQKHTQSFDESLASESGKNGFLFLNEEDPDLFCVISEWFYTGELPGPPSHISNSRPPNEATAKRMENDLHSRFKAAENKLVEIYALADKWNMSDLMNCAIDAVKDGFSEYYTAFSSALLIKIFKITKPGWLPTSQPLHRCQCHPHRWRLQKSKA
ncbi:uncharacterized protein RAG0_11130 [Rhynchosporium agropyri]|uniref:BTB domain-containing protein n=1 Tax=Rhynchosporium agropyri TaxID=914238 RepID=A0A1E1L2U0_9HELO|nr:uncharacterized protein RAG0_11130 [Rhynchosporium agropyri]